MSPLNIWVACLLINKASNTIIEKMYSQIKIRRGNDFCKEQAQQRFNIMDSNNDGVLSADELLYAPQNQGNKKRPVN